MAFAPNSTYFDQKGTILGSFTEVEHGYFFEFSVNDEELYPEYPHKVWVCTPWEMDQGFRYAKVLKTVAYILVDEDKVEKWSINKYNEYENRQKVRY